MHTGTVNYIADHLGTSHQTIRAICNNMQPIEYSGKWKKYDVNAVTSAYDEIANLPINPPPGCYPLTEISKRNHISAYALQEMKEDPDFPPPAGQYRAANFKITPYYNEHDVLNAIGVEIKTCTHTGNTQPADTFGKWISYSCKDGLKHAPHQADLLNWKTSEENAATFGAVAEYVVL